MDQPLADLDLEKQHGKVIQRRGGARNKLLEKGMKTPSSLVRGTQRQFSENICSEDDLRSRIFGTFVVKFLACLPL